MRGINLDAESIYKKIISIFNDNDKSLEPVKLIPNKAYHTIEIEGNAAIRLIISSKNQYISVKLKYEKLLINPIIPGSAKSQKDWIKYQISTEDDLDKIRLALIEIYDNCKPSGSMFGCCSRFNACSDAKKCIHPDRNYAKNCWYQENMKQGKIFYGKNRSI